MLARGTHSSIDAGSQYGTGFLEKGSWESGIWMEGARESGGAGEDGFIPRFNQRMHQSPRLPPPSHTPPNLSMVYISSPPPLIIIHR